MMHLTVMAVLQGACGDHARLTAFDAHLVVAATPDALFALHTVAHAPTRQPLDAMGQPAQPPVAWPGAADARDAAVAGPVVVTWGDGLRAHDAVTGAARWAVRLPGADASDREVIVALDLQHEELGVLWQREYPISPDRPGYNYPVVHFARLGLDGRWLTPTPIDVTPRDPTAGATLGYHTPLRQLRWTGRAYRFVYWQYDSRDPSRGDVRLGEVTRDGAGTSRSLARERADVISVVDGPAGLAVAWNTVLGSRPAVRVLLPGGVPTTLDAYGSSPRIAWHRGAYYVAWDHVAASPDADAAQGTRLVRMLPGRGVVATFDAPHDAARGEWAATSDLFTSPCGVVVQGYTASARAARPWLWFVP
jgi:hypothetical protein